MTYQPILSETPIRMRQLAQNLIDNPSKKKIIKWLKKDWSYILKKKKFRIYSMRVGQSTKYKLAMNENSYLWTEVSAPARSSWEYREEGEYLYFRMLVDGVPRTNEISQKR